MSFWDDMQEPPKSSLGQATAPEAVTPPAAAHAIGTPSFVAIVMETTLPDGTPLVVAQDQAAADAVTEQQGSKVMVWTLDEVAKLIASEPLIGAVKHVFPGATVTQGSRRRPEPSFFDDMRPDAFTGGWTPQEAAE